ncbi:uncharacterized protein LOC115090003 isoform X2 [Rhinatrema bivittatum]|uniref:uncharacterized protein LOC115082297 isoform X2 n=1 Tax=Rhinatrema bivittatum TaxID=194408 RepID=UPI00112E9A6B|nr:uncharacterized protein LOC115082297 isoform X2 [Rhinatrema bivittatum]XP_029442391.1 uncharacterized protein LOC115082297 isoform X2 [Rhinatrema bivittatum]XP_029442392.1 uncharacterized protein LOC115082297 isoform X2 [Rhinatrema bivittatum]XP_029454396.1 uncharacterized protein LOC115090003 isoform X2 [Rhinatrema bivittatum]XP_029454397.1 uncharacterized protein LOC115090003 isoform X2 [Rhinatrema bivittatum]XP_029454398.1 uncharacterized protein LOC115090003 isoform X2 [Rhinatrema bivit
MERSKIPVYSQQGPIQSGNNCVTYTNLPCPKKICPSKPILPLFNKHPNISFAVKDPTNGVFKATSQRPALASKRTPCRGSLARYKVDAELRDKNKVLEANNLSLHRDLTKAQETIKDLTAGQEILEREVKELNKRLERNMVILESRNIDPDTGNRILESIEETNNCQKEAKLLRENLIKELKNFSETTAKKVAELQEIKSKQQAAEEAGHRFLEEYQAFLEEMKHYQLSLKQGECLLDNNG